MSADVARPGNDHGANAMTDRQTDEAMNFSLAYYASDRHTGSISVIQSTPWGVPTKGYKTRKNKRTDNMIVRRRNKK